MTPSPETLRCLFANCLMLSLCGCQFGHPVAGVVPPGADCAKLIMFDSKSPRMLLHVDEQNRTLRYVTSAAEPEQLGLVHTYDFNGALINKQLLPIFRCGGWEHGSTTWGGAVSPNCGGVAYLEHQYPRDSGACDLVYLNFDTGLRSVLVRKLAKEPQELAWLAWVDTNRLTVAKYAKYSRGEEGLARLMIIDAPHAEVKLDLTCTDLSHFAVSHARKYLAYWEATKRFSGQGPVHILNLQTLQKAASTESGKLATFGRLEWNSEDDKLAYVMDNQLRTFSLATKQSQTLFTFGCPSDQVALQGYQNGKLYYRAEDQKDHVDRLQWLDEVTRTPIRFKNHPEGPFNAYICRDGTIIYYKLGQKPLY